MPRLLKNICLISFLLFLGISFVFAEDITITTYYPSPYGVYNQLQTQTMGVGDNDGDGSLDSGDIPDPAANPGSLWVKGSVGIGTTEILSEVPLSVAGGIKTGDVLGACNADIVGAIRWHVDDEELQYCDGSAWQRLQKGGLSATCDPSDPGPFVWDNNSCSCGYGGYVWRGTVTYTCTPEGQWQWVAEDCWSYKPADAGC